MTSELKQNFNVNHPELREGEVRLTNMIPDRIIDGQTDWEAIGHKTKRTGNVAYSLKGEPIEEYKPVFVQKSELDEAGIL